MKLKKSVKIRGTVYDVEVGEDYINAGETHYPMPGYGNNYGTEWDLRLKGSSRWAKITVHGYNNTYATRGHGLTDYWTISEDFIRRDEAEAIIQEIRGRLEKAEDHTPDVREVLELFLEAIGESREEH